MPRLQQLNLSRNPLTGVSGNSFTSLRYLEVNECKLNTFQSNQLPKVEYLYLNSNLLADF